VSGQVAAAPRSVAAAGRRRSFRIGTGLASYRLYQHETSLEMRQVFGVSDLLEVFDIDLYCCRALRAGD